MAGYLWLLAIVFLITLVYPPATAGIGCAALTVTLVLWLARR